MKKWLREGKTSLSEGAESLEWLELRVHVVPEILFPKVNAHTV